MSEIKAHTEAGRTALGKAVLSKWNLVVARACQMVEDFQLESLSTELESAFRTWLDRGRKEDAGCRAKTALAHTLTKLEVECPDLYLRGSRTVQMEPVFGGSEDTAGELRGLCGLGLVRSFHEHALEVLADLLADPSPATRSLAARALLEKGGPESSALVRFRVRCGEEEPPVLLECLTALVVLTGERGIRLTEELYLDSPRNPHWPVAILALGEARTELAGATLIEHFQNCVTAPARQQILEAIALSRTESGLQFLLKLVEEGHDLAEAAAELVRRFRGDRHSLQLLSACRRRSP